MSRQGDPSTPIDEGEFAARMAALGPYERAPRLAVAVSGGADSMALLLLSRDWAAACGGSVVALTVDHGLRPEAATEAARVARWAAALGIPHRVLNWTGAPPRGDLQAAARAARYHLLESACAEMAIFHLLLGHHRGDQAETFLLRLARGSGLDGLAGMSAIVERPDCRLLRPLLSAPGARLRATLEARGQPWIEDPSNRNPAFARVRLRQSRAILAREGLDEARLAETAARLGRARAALEPDLARLLVRVATPHPAGFVRLDSATLAQAPAELGLRALAAILAAVGGNDYPPRLVALERLYAEIGAGPSRGRTLAGCRILPHRGALLVCREPAALAAPVSVPPGGKGCWDRRFHLILPDDAPAGMMLGALGPARLSADRSALPAAVWASLPALRDEKGIVAVPLLHYLRDGGSTPSVAFRTMLLRTARPATGAGIKVV
jgi:tRNA(Ile)-lysidine synthase